VLVISGGPSPKDRTKDILIHHKVRTFDTQQRIYAEVTCANAVLLDPETAAAEIMRVVSCAPKAHFTSGGRFHPGNCRLSW
jgi:indolepyruvate decarboxylase